MWHAFASQATMVICPSNLRKIVDFLDLHSKGQIFGISLFCCNFKIVRPKTVYFGIHVRFDKGVDAVNSRHIANVSDFVYGETFEICVFVVCNLPRWNCVSLPIYTIQSNEEQKLEHPPSHGALCQ